MLRNAFFSVVLLAAVAAPAVADECGSAPIPPAFPSASELNQKPVDAARKDVLDSYHLVKTFMASNTSFRSCLERLSAADTADIDAGKAKADDAKVKAAQAHMATLDTSFKTAIATAQKVADEFNTLRLDHCKRDTDTKVCPQAKK